MLLLVRGPSVQRSRRRRRLAAPKSRRSPQPSSPGAAADPFEEAAVFTGASFQGKNV